MAPPPRQQQQRRQGSRRLAPPATSQPTLQRPVKDVSYYDAMEHGHHIRGSEIFVGGLARSVTEDMIKEMFLPYGDILELRMMKDHSGISKGYCFVRFSTKDAALKAQKERNGFVLNGKKIGVEPSSDQDCLFFGNLCKDWSVEEFDKLIHKVFQDVVCVELAMPSSSCHPASGKKQLNRGFAFVQFSTHAAAARAYRIGSSSDFMLAGNWHPAVDWAEKEPELDPEELAKIKVAFVGNLPANVDEEYLKELFKPLGKLEKVALSRKGHFPVGFVHFRDRSDLDKSIKEMDGQTVPGPHKGPSFKIQVAVARPMENDRKRVRDEAKSKPNNKLGTRHDYFTNTHGRGSFESHKSKVPRFAEMESNVADPYEEAVISLPPALKEHLLRILRLGIATRYDIDMHCIASLKELPESAALAVLDQFMLSGAERRNKGEYFVSLIAKVIKLGSGWGKKLPGNPNDFDFPSEPELLRGPVSISRQAIDFHASQPTGSSAVRYIGSSTSPGSFSYLPEFDDDLPRTSLRKLEGKKPMYRIVTSSREREPAYHTETSSIEVEPTYRTATSFIEMEPTHPRATSSIEMEPARRTAISSIEMEPAYRTATPSIGYSGRARLASQLSPASDYVPERPQMKFDPFTGKPFKFDPFTGEPIRPESASRYVASHR